MKPLCIYHGNCADGFGSAWVVWKYFGGEVDFYPGVYQRPPPDVTGRLVFMVDFSYKSPVLLDMADKAHAIFVIDHHKTAQADLANYQTRHYTSYERVLAELDRQRFFLALFDMERSGCGMTWDFFHPGTARPALLNHLEDRDLWKFQLPFTREIQAMAFSQKYDFQVWDDMINKFERFGEYRESVIDQGEAIERKHFKDIEELVEVVTRPMKFQIPIRPETSMRTSETVPAANLPYTMTSDAGHLLCSRSMEGRPAAPGNGEYSHPFAACYWDTPNGRQFSLRSEKGKKNAADVGAIAQLYGGGGHINASGFLVPFFRLPEFEP